MMLYNNDQDLIKNFIIRKIMSSDKKWSFYTIKSELKNQFGISIDKKSLLKRIKNVKNELS